MANLLTEKVKRCVRVFIKFIKGDVIIIEASEHPLSVDCVLLAGNAVADESSLTGEALPVSKTCIVQDNTPFSVAANGKRNCLFAGCHVLETQSESRDHVTALVLATGAATTKGKLIRDMLYPLPIMFVFLEHLKIVFPILFIWGIVMLIASVLILGADDIDSWFYGMFTISQILSPLLPAVLVIGQSISARRLYKKGIMCVDLQRITLAGKVKVFCFDKTGKLE
jgi:magnesium-transporting ATPase (P-type)